MRLDHLLSREYTKSVLSDHGLGQRRDKFEFELIALYSFEGAGNSTFKGQKDEGRDHRGGVAQLGEHLLCKQGVIGSIPFISTTLWQERAMKPFTGS